MCSGIAVDSSITPKHGYGTKQALSFETPWYMDKLVSNLFSQCYHFLETTKCLCV